MSVLRAILGGFVAIFAGCNKSPKQDATTQSMSTEDLIASLVNAPVGQSIGPIARALSDQLVFVGTDQEGAAEAVKPERNSLRFMTALDSEGNEWAYAYTTMTEFERLIPSGTPYIALSFADFFSIVEGDSRFRGIFLNAGSDSSYPIPRELFGDVKDSIRERDGG